MTDSYARTTAGRFAPGSKGGPGRPPRRNIEREYLSVLGEAVTLDDWRRVVGKALADAIEGDAKAREWLARYVLGNEPLKLEDLAVSEFRGLTADDAVLVGAMKQEEMENVLADIRNASATLASERYSPPPDLPAATAGCTRPEVARERTESGTQECTGYGHTSTEAGGT